MNRQRSAQRHSLVIMLGLMLLSGMVQLARAQDEPTVNKPSVQVTAWTIDSYHKSFDVWSWVPSMKFTVNGPIASGDQLYVEFFQAGSSKPWVSFDCPTQEIPSGNWWR